MNSSPHSRRSYKEKCGAKGAQTASILRMYDTENISLPQPDQQVLTSNPLPLPQPISSRFSNFSTIGISLERNGSIIGIRQPHAGLKLHRAACPFLIIEVVYSESEEHVVQKAKEYIRCSRGRIVYVIIVSVATLTKINSPNPHTESQPHDSQILEESPPLSPLTSLGSTPTSPSVINQRYGIVPLGDSQQNSSKISLAPRALPDKDSRQR